MAGKRIAVLGDLMIDEYVFGETNRISREAPVLILKFRSRTIGYGGASNAVANIASFGGVPIPVGVVGKDNSGESLLELFSKCGIPTGTILSDGKSTTTSKTRIIAGGMHSMRQQLVRIDMEPSAVPAPEKIIALLKRAMESGIDGLLISDYGYGALSDQVIRFVNSIAKKNDFPVAVDSRYQLLKYRYSRLAAPNEEEAGMHAGKSADDLAKIEKAGESLRKKLKSRCLLITRGSEGISLFAEDENPFHVSVFGSKIAVDTTGAGDTVVSTALLALCSGATYRESAVIANHAGGLVVMKKGAATISPAELTSTF